ncbi:hypothetical protein, partial [Cellulomonas septica]
MARSVAPARRSVAAETFDEAAVALRRAARAAVALPGDRDVLLGRDRGGAVEVARDGDVGADALDDEPLHDHDALAGAAAQLVTAMGKGWNLGNQLEANINGVPSETAWG